MLRMLTVALSLLGVGAALLPSADTAWGCAAVGRYRVEIAEESAIIIWDAATKTQHFIRRASFKTKAKDFGFLVPTPTRPELAEAGDRAFTFLDRLTAPRRLVGGGGGKGRGGRASGGAPVQVLEKKRVAGYDAAVLQASSPKALNAWLKKHGYVSSPELVEWLKPYVARRWKVTAFKIARDEQGAPEVSTSAVRMTFKTERPFFPYREPKPAGDQAPQAESGTGRNRADAPPRLLRIYFLGAGHVRGTLGEKGRWEGWATWSKQMSKAESDRLAADLRLPAKAPKKGWWLTKTEDRSSPRPGTDDVFFARFEYRASVPAEQIPPPKSRPAPAPAEKDRR